MYCTSAHVQSFSLTTLYFCIDFRKNQAVWGDNVWAHFVEFRPISGLISENTSIIFRGIELNSCIPTLELHIVLFPERFEIFDIHLTHFWEIFGECYLTTFPILSGALPGVQKRAQCNNSHCHHMDSHWNGFDAHMDGSSFEGKDE